MSFLTCFWLLPQKEHFSRSPPSPIRATCTSPCSLRPTPGADCVTSDGTAFGARAGHLDGLTPSCRSKVSAGRAHGESAGLPGLDDLIHKAVVDGLLGGEDLVPFDVDADLFFGAARVIGDEGLEERAHAQNLARLDLDVAALAVTALGRRLVDDDAAVLERVALARRTRGKQYSGGTRGLTEADRLDLRLDELHRVVDRRQRRERSARRVDVHDDVAVGIGGLETQQLRHDVVGRSVVDLDTEEDDPLLEQLVVRVGLLDAVRRPLDERRQHIAPARLIVTHEFAPALAGICSTPVTT